MALATRSTLVTEHITRRTRSRALGAGDKLPSVRGLASRLDVSPLTVVEAYDILAAEGALLRKWCEGFTV